MFSFDVEIDQGSFDAAIAKIDAALNPQTSPALAAGLMDAGMVLLDFERQHFIASSAGGGDWEPHAESTVNRTGPHPIFYGTQGRIYEAMFIRGGDGHFEGIDGDAFRFGATGGSSDPSPSQLAVWHHHGTVTCPARPILIDPGPVAGRVAMILASAVAQALGAGVSAIAKAA